MSIQGSYTGITFSGLSSGIDSDSIIQQLIKLEQIPIQRLQVRQARLQGQMDVYAQFSAALKGFASAAVSLNNTAAYSPITARSSNTEVATLSSSSGASAGVYSLAVSKLASAHKVSSAAGGSATETLTSRGITPGTFVVNGKAIAATGDDTLTTLAQKINSAQAGVTASLINGGANQVYLTLSAATSGKAARIQLADASGGVLAGIGLTTGSTAIREATTTGIASARFSSNNTALGTLMGFSTPPSGVVSLGGASNVTIDFATDTLDTIAGKLGATVVSGTDANGATTYRLEITGSTNPAFTDQNGILESLGFIQKSYGSEITAGQDAEFKLDGISLTNATNTVTGVVPGATITLLKANATTPETSTLTLTRDDAAVKRNIKQVADAYNALQAFVTQNSQFNKDTFETGPLFGNSLVSQVQSQVSQIVFQNQDGVSGTYKNLSQIGFSFDPSGMLQIDDSKLSAALAASPENVGQLFRSFGQTNANGLEYIGGTSKTKTSSGSGYEVSITQAATQANVTAGSAFGAIAGTETLTFTGAAFGTSGYQFLINPGETIGQVITRIGNDSKLKDLITATDEGGMLKLTAKRYGTPGHFSVVSSLPAGPDTSGIGSTLLNANNGLDVAGTIAGELATGSGQYLTGNSDNANSSGLQVLVKATSPGSIGYLKYSKGLAQSLYDMANQMTTTENGSLTSASNSLQSQIDDITSQIGLISERITAKEGLLRLRFAAMERAVSSLKSQGSQLSNVLASQQNNAK